MMDGFRSFNRYLIDIVR